MWALVGHLTLRHLSKLTIEVSRSFSPGQVAGVHISAFLIGFIIIIQTYHHYLLNLLYSSFIAILKQIPNSCLLSVVNKTCRIVLHIFYLRYLWVTGLGNNMKAQLNMWMTYGFIEQIGGGFSCFLFVHNIYILISNSFVNLSSFLCNIQLYYKLRKLFLSIECNMETYLIIMLQLSGIQYFITTIFVNKESICIFRTNNSICALEFLILIFCVHYISLDSRYISFVREGR